jgi:hypothetical protein
MSSEVRFPTDANIDRPPVSRYNGTALPANPIMNLITILNLIATLVSTAAYIVTALYIRAELKGLEKDRYLTATGELFAIFQSREFMEAQLWLLHRLQETDWHSFVQTHRADTGEMAFHRVGSFYDRVGVMVRMGLINEKEILTTMGGYAIAVWEKIGPLVHEARQMENSALFADFERMLPACRECYVPNLNATTPVHPFALPQPIARVRPVEVKRRLERGDRFTLLDVRRADQMTQDNRILPRATLMPPDAVSSRYAELPPDREVVVYCA